MNPYQTYDAPKGSNKLHIVNDQENVKSMKGYAFFPPNIDKIITLN